MERKGILCLIRKLKRVEGGVIHTPIQPPRRDVRQAINILVVDGGIRQKAFAADLPENADTLL